MPSQLALPGLALKQQIPLTMNPDTKESTTLTVAEQLIRQVLTSWAAQDKALVAAFSKFDDATYELPVAPGRNQARPLLGHLTATADGMLPLLGFGPRLYPHLADRYFAAPAQAPGDEPTLPELRQQWETVTATLATHFAALAPTQWLEKHANVSAEDFALDPLRNKLSIVLGRTNHQSYHLGQLAFLTPAVGASPEAIKS